MLAALALTACSQVSLTAIDALPTSSASPATPSTSAPRTASPGPSPSASSKTSTAPAAIPTACSKVVSPDAYATIFGGTPLNDPKVVGPSDSETLTPMPSETGAAPGDIVFNAVSLRCVWRDPAADITGISIEYSRVEGSVATAYLAELEASGYSCGDAAGGVRCQQTGIEPQYQVDVAQTVLARDGIVISVNQANFPTDNLLSQLAVAIWGE